MPRSLHCTAANGAAAPVGMTTGETVTQQTDLKIGHYTRDALGGRRLHEGVEFGYDSKRRNEEITVATKSATAGKIAKILKSTIVYEGPVFGVRRDEVLEPGGLRTTREVITHSGSVVVLPVLPDGKIVLIRQYRHATRQYLWELVAGRMDGNETPKQGAARELLEETGYRAKKFRVFLYFWPTPGFLEEKMYILLAEGLTAGKAQPEEDEKIVTKSYSVNELKQMVRTNKIRDAKTIAALLYYFTFLR